MTSAAADRNDLVPSQEKLEWVTPTISLMVAVCTAGNKLPGDETGTGGGGVTQGLNGPS